MKAEDHISQGQLELYHLEVLSNQEKEEVEQYLKDPAYRKESDEIEFCLEQVAFSGSISPPEELRGKIMAQLELPNRQGQNPSSGFSRYLLAASVSLVLLSSVMAVWFWNQWQGAEEVLSELKAENFKIAENRRLTQNRLLLAEETLTILSNPAFETIQLAGVGRTTGYTSEILWNAQSHETYLKRGTLHELTDDQQYQLWSIQDGKPVDAGVFDSKGNDFLIKMKDVSSAEAFAITIEPRGGSAVPTLDQMVVSGAI